MIKLTIFLFLFSTSIFARPKCRVELYKEYLILKHTKIPNDLFKNESTCPDEVLKQFKSIFIFNKKNISEAQINKDLYSKLKPYYIEMEPKLVSFKTIDQVVNSKKLIKNNLLWKNFKVNSRRSIYPIREGSQLLIEAQDSQEPGKNKNLNIVINNPFIQTSTTIHLNADLLKKQIIWKAKNKIQNQSERLSKKLFYKTNSYTHLSDAINDINFIKFKKLNKSLKKNETLKISDLVHDYIVRPGQPTTAVFNSNKLSVITKVRAFKSGKLGEFIYVENIKSKTKIIGKVIDYNKVEIEL